MSEAYVDSLEKIADVHIDKSPSHIVDSTILAFDREKMLPYIKGPKVLELGFGDGDWTRRMIEIFGSSYVVDASKKLLGYGVKQFGGAMQGFQSLFEEFNPPQGLRFNSIIASHVLEHVDDPVLVLSRCKSWLAPEGEVLIIVPNATSLHRRLAVLMEIQGSVYDFSPRDYEVGHQRVYDLEHLREDVKKAGYEVVVERGLCLKVLPNSMMIEYSDDLLKAMVDISDDLPSEWMANLAMVIKPSVESG